MYDSVLLPTDGSTDSKRALEHAIGIAKRNDATLHIFHVVETGTLSDSVDDPAYENVLNRIEEAGREALEALAENAREAGIEPEQGLRKGNAVEEILSYAEDRDIDIIVMPTYGRTGEARQVIGSVTERVVRNASTPVLTINVSED
jgi:nucleotide-binding universal stress UspA family protein